MSFAALTIDINAKLANLEAGLKGTEAQLKGFASKAETIAGSLQAAFGAIAGAFVVDAIVGKFAAAVAELAALDDAAEQSGASVEELSSILNTLAPTGVTLEQITDATGKLAKAMRESSDESSAQARAFAAIGVATKDAEGNYRSTGQVLVEVAQALARYEDGTNKTVLAQILLGKTGAANLPMLKDLATRQQEASTATSEDAAQAERLSNAWRALKRDGELVAQTLASAVIPSLANLAEQFRATGKAGGSFYEQLRAVLGPNKFLTQLGEELADLQEQRARLANDTRPLMQIGKDKGLAELDRQIEAVRARMERIRPAAEIAKPSMLQGGYNPGLGLQSAPIVDEGTAKTERAAKATQSEAERLLETLTRQLDVTRDLTLEQQVLAQIGRGEIDGLTPALEQQILLRAVQVDKVRELASAIKAATAEETADNDAIKRMNEDARKSREREVEAIRNAIDPTRELYAQLDRVKALMAGELIPADVGNARLMQIYGQIDRVLLEIPDKAEQASDAIKALGFEFESAFEKAVVDGAKVSDVLRGLVADIAKFYLRQQITSPLLSMLGGTFDPAKQGGTLIGLLASSITGKAVGGPVSAGTPYIVGERGPELMVPKTAGTIVPAGKFGGGVTINQVVNVGSGVNRNEVAAAMVAAKEAAKAEILQSMRRGGAYAVA